MAHFELPYGKGSLPFDIDDSRVNGVLLSHIEEYDPGKTQEELVAGSLACPIASESLAELAKGKKKITVISSDHTRPVPSRIIMPQILAEIRRGNPDADITILIATGCHRETRKEELIDKFGPEIVEKEHIVVHDCDDVENQVMLGILPSGGECWVNRLAVDADLLVAEGFIEPHFFAGFSGGRKSILPGVAGRTTVLANHCSEFIADPCSRAAVLEGNPIHKDMVWAAEHAGLRFIVNVVLNGAHDIIHCVSGDLVQAHEAGCSFLESLCCVEPVYSDIVISTNGGYPLDQNVYQSVKGMTGAEGTVNQDGVIIMLSKSADGHGGEAFCKEMQASDDLQALMDGWMARDRNQTLPDQWQAQIFVRVLQKARLVYISDSEDELIRSLHMTPAHSMDEAMKLAEQMLGKTDAKVTVIPDGVSVVVKEA